MRDLYRIPLSLLLVTTVLGCDQKPAEPAEPVPQKDTPPEEKAPEATPPAASPSIGALDSAFIASISRHPTADKIEIEVNADGSVRELALYHNDADKLPEAVRKKAEEVYPGASIKGYESEVEGPERREVFEVELKTAEGQECEVEATAAGELIYTECEVEVSTLGEELKAATLEALPGAEIEEVEIVEHSGDRPKETVVEAKVGETTHKLVFIDGKLSRHVREIKAELEFDVPLP